MNHVRIKVTSRLREEVIGDDPFVGEDHKDAGGEALVPGVFGHELDKIARRRAREDGKLRVLDEDFNIVAPTALRIRHRNVVEGGEAADDFVVELMHKGGEFVGDDEHGVVFKVSLRGSDYGSLGVDKSVDHGSH